MSLSGLRFVAFPISFVLRSWDTVMLPFGRDSLPFCAQIALEHAGQMESPSFLNAMDLLKLDLEIHGGETPVRFVIGAGDEGETFSYSEG